jgi:hypothetical protein
MGFETGAVSFRIYHWPRKLPDDAIARFAAHVPPPIDTLGEGVYTGWVTGRHLLDRNINEATAMVGGYLRLTMLQAEKKIPASLLKAECRMEELAQQAAESKSFLSRKEKTDIKNSVIARLLPQMPPQLRGIDLVQDPGAYFMFAGAITYKQNDAFTSLMQQTMGFCPIPWTPEQSAHTLAHAMVDDWPPSSFSAKVNDEQVETAPGREFLTWLWYISERQGGEIRLPQGEKLSVLIEGPLTFVHEGNGAHEITLRKGEPINSAEAKSCLLSGKKLKEARVTFALDDDYWVFRMNADEFAFKSMNMSKTEEMLDPISLFQDRMLKIDHFKELFDALYLLFLKERAEPSVWKKTVTSIRQWVTARAERR